MNMSYFVGNKEYFPDIPAIPFEGRGSKNPLSFKFYDKNKVVAGKTMQEHLRFAVCYWHTFCATGSDPFGSAIRIFPWEISSNAIENAKNKLDAAFEFITNSICRKEHLNKIRGGVSRIAKRLRTAHK
jgi:xylose isomerase